MRGAADGFDINLFLSKLNDNPEEGPMPLTGTDEEFIADVNDTFTGEYSGEKGAKFWQKIDGMTEGGHELWKATIHFPKSRPLDFPVRQLKFKIVEFINTSYKDNYHATSTIPPWLGEFMYNAQSGATTESLTEDKEAFDKNNVQDLAQEFIEDILSMGDNPNDMTVYDFMDWAWDGKVPEADQKYVSTMFNAAKREASQNECVTEGINIGAMYAAANREGDDCEKLIKKVVDYLAEKYLTSKGWDGSIDFADNELPMLEDGALEYVKANFDKRLDWYCQNDPTVDGAYCDDISDEDIEAAFYDFMANIYEDI
jgi:hypothetical protein